MTDLTKLTLAGAREGLRQKQFSATELAQAFLAAIEAGNKPLNAYVLPTPERALAQAKDSDARLAKGDARPLEGLPLGIKDLYCTKGVRTTACSNILDDFTPTYELTVTQNLWDAGAVMLGKLNCDEFAMGSSNETSCFGPVIQPLAAQGLQRRRWCRAAPRAARPRPWPPTCASPPPPPTPAARSASRRPSPAPSASSRPTGAARAGASSRSPPRSTRRGRSPRPCAMRPSCCATWRASTRRTPPASMRPCRTTRRRVGQSIKGLKVGVPKEYRVDGMPKEIEDLWQQGIAWLKAAGATIHDVSLPHTKYALPAYYIVAPAECSSNLARYDGVRYGLRKPGNDLIDTYEDTRAAGFGAEVRRRVLIGTYVLSAGYYDAYYLKAQKVRTLIKRDFDAGVREGGRAADADHAVGPAFGIGEVVRRSARRCT